MRTAKIRIRLDAQADLSLRRAHSHFVGFVMRRLICYINTVARIVLCRQDGRGRYPVYRTSSPNVGQTRKENPNTEFFI